MLDVDTLEVMCIRHWKKTGPPPQKQYFINFIPEILVEHLYQLASIRLWERYLCNDCSCPIHRFLHSTRPKVMATASPCIPHPEPCGMSVPWPNGCKWRDPAGWKMDALFCCSGMTSTQVWTCKFTCLVGGVRCLKWKVPVRISSTRTRQPEDNFPILHKLWFTKTPSEAWFHPAWAAFDHRRLRASLGVSRLCWEGWGTWWDAKSSRVAIYIIYFKHVDGSSMLHYREMWILVWIYQLDQT